MISNTETSQPRLRHASELYGVSDVKLKPHVQLTQTTEEQMRKTKTRNGFTLNIPAADGVNANSVIRKFEQVK